MTVPGTTAETYYTVTWLHTTEAHGVGAERTSVIALYSGYSTMDDIPSIVGARCGYASSEVRVVNIRPL